MNIGRDDAASALAEVARARRIAEELRGYAHAGDIVAGWGLVWLVCNLLTYFFPGWGYQSWGPGIVLGTLWSIQRGRKDAQVDRRALASAAATVGFLALVLLIAGVDDPVQVNALISLFVAGSYVTMGIWTGPRLAWIGLGIAALVTAGWFLDRANLPLWLGLGGGGALIATGLWLRRA